MLAILSGFVYSGIYSQTVHAEDSPVNNAVSLPETVGGAMYDTFNIKDDSVKIDSAKVTIDSLSKKQWRPNVSLPADSTPSKFKREKADLETAVDFTAKDSLIFMGKNTAFMYGNGKVVYGDISLDADEIRMNMKNSTVYAVGRPDSVGDIEGSPIFKDGSGEYESKTMTYNFKTKKGYITDVVTQQGEGYLTGGITKKMENDEYYIKNGRYTTCDDHECPHFYMQLTKAKVKPKKNITTGPAYMVLADVPLPLAVPFGFFPFSDKYSSGVIFPTFGEDYNKGFYIRDGGYYFAINDYVDLAVTGELYTKGSWGLTAQSNYAKRYKFSGNFDISYITSVYGDKGSPDYSKQNNFKVAWTHSQDAKANPNMSFSASVNFTTSGYTRNDLNSYYNNSFTENTKSSTVNMTYRFPNSKWTLSTTANISQRTSDSTLTVSFPNVTVTMSQMNPFKRKRAVGNERWYEKINLSYSGYLTNSLTAKQDQFFKKSLIKDWDNQLKHTVPVQATFNVFKYINVTPRINMNDWMYFKKVRREWDPENRKELFDTLYNFYNVFDFNAGIDFSTKIYGFFKPMKFLGDKVQMIRHVLTPTVSLSASPDFTSQWWGYYGNYEKTTEDESGNYVTENVRYPYYPVRPSGKSGTVTLSLANNLEMKVKSNSDSTGVKKVSLIENFTVSQYYNFAADSFKWGDINTSIMLRLVKNFNLSLSANWDVYTYNENGRRIDVTRLQAGKGLARLRSTGTSFSYTFNNSTFKRKDSGDKKGDSNKEVPEEIDKYTDQDGTQEEQSERKSTKKADFELNPDGYMKWDVPWSLTLNYSINYGYGAFNKVKKEYDSKITQNLSFSGNIRPTKNWNFNLSASYNFDTGKIAYMNCTISRDLHCFTMSASFVPVGPYKSYNFHISVKSSLLKDLKYDKRSSSSNGITWY